jgi:trigger factor
MPAELDTEFYDRLFGAGKIADEAAFREELTTILKRDAQNESDVRLMNDIRAAVINSVQFNLPENFLKRWVMAVDKNVPTPEAADDHMEKNREGIRWEVIRMVLAEENQVEASEEEIYNNARSMVIGKLAEMGMPADDEERLKKIVFNVLENQNEYNKIRSFIIEQKVLTLLRDKVNVTEQEVDYRDFWKQ